jgi:hypothetical protein
VFNSNNPNDVMRMVDDAYERIQQGGVFSGQQVRGPCTSSTWASGRLHIGGVPGGLSGNPAVNHIQPVLQNGNEVVTAFRVAVGRVRHPRQAGHHPLGGRGGRGEGRLGRPRMARGRHLTGTPGPPAV